MLALAGEIGLEDIWVHAALLLELADRVLHRDPLKSLKELILLVALPELVLLFSVSLTGQLQVEPLGVLREEDPLEVLLELFLGDRLEHSDSQLLPVEQVLVLLDLVPGSACGLVEAKIFLRVDRENGITLGIEVLI